MGRFGEKDAASCVTEDAFRYFASLTSETILATCGFCMHVRDFYVPLVPLGTEEEERKAEEERREAARRTREREHGPKSAASGEAAGGDAGSEGPEHYFEEPDFIATIESLRTTPEERAERCKTKGNDAMSDPKGGKPAKEVAVQVEG